MRLVTKVHDQSKGLNGWNHMFITFDGITRLEEIEQTEVKIAIDSERDIKMQHEVKFKKDMRPIVIREDEGKVQTVRYERAVNTRLEPLQINKDLLGNSENDGSSVFSTNDSLSIGRPESTVDTADVNGSFQQIKMNGKYKSCYYKKNHPYRYYKSISRGSEFFCKKSYLKQDEILENDPGYYKRIMALATGEGHYENGLSANDFNKFAEDVAKKKPTIILKNEGRTKVSSIDSGSSKPRSPMEGASVVSQTDQTWSDYHINPIQKYASG